MTTMQFGSFSHRWQEVTGTVWDAAAVTVHGRHRRVRTCRRDRMLLLVVSVLAMLGVAR